LCPIIEKEVPMRPSMLAAIAATSLALCSAPARAGEGCGSAGSAASVVHHIFDMADRDGSGTLTEAEYGAAGLERFGVSFADSDADGDGETSQAEYLELYERHHSDVADDERISL
jgi:hypothetical protein